MTEKRPSKYVFTDDGIARLKIPPAGKRWEYRDPKKTGLVVRVSDKGARSFRLEITSKNVANGKKQVLVLGRCEDMTVEHARELAKRHRSQMLQARISLREQRINADGQDKDRAAATFEAKAKLFLERYPRTTEIPLRASTIRGYRNTLQGTVKAWNNLPVSQISKAKVREAIEGLQMAGKPAAARSLHTYLAVFFKWLEERGEVTSNPVQGIRRAKVTDRARNLSLDELRHVLDAATKLDPVQQRFVAMLALTGQRRLETSLMRWSDLVLDGDEPTWTIPGEVAKNREAHEVPLPPQLVKLLTELPRIGVYVFTLDGKLPINCFSFMKSKLDAALGDKVAPWRFHDLRRSFVTIMNDREIAAPYVIEACVNHTEHKKGVAKVYNRAGFRKQRRLALAAWVSLLLEARASDNVVTLRA